MIKWENIALILFGGCDIYSIISHAINGQTGLYTLYEIFIYGMFTFALWYGIRDIRLGIKKSTLRSIHNKGTSK